MNSTSRPRIWTRVFLVSAVLLVPLAAAGRLADLEPPTTITLQGKTTQVSPGTTLGSELQASGLRPATGRLLDVEGEVLEPRADPGGIEINGRESSRRAVLEEGDEVVVIDGEDRTEPTKLLFERLGGRHPANPQYFVGTSRMRQVTTIGEISGKVVSVTYEPIGKARVPREVALTFDDGPWPGSTKKILGVLRKTNAKATFFMIGYLAERHPRLVKKVDRAGMSVGTHSYGHPYVTPFVQLAEQRIEDEIAGGKRVLEEIGVETSLFRPPGGSWNDDVVETARGYGVRLVLWDVDPHDWEGSGTPASIATNVLRGVRRGSIVLLHDGGGNASDTIRALPDIIRGIRKKGLRLTVLE